MSFNEAVYINFPQIFAPMIEMCSDFSARIMKNVGKLSGDGSWKSPPCKRSVHMFLWEVPSGLQLKFYEAGKQKYVHNLTALIWWESGTEFKTKLCHLNMRTHCAPDTILVTFQLRQMSHCVSLPGKGNSKEGQLVPVSNIENMFIKKYPNCEFLQLLHCCVIFCLYPDK